MEAWLYIASKNLVVAIETMALIIIAVGTVEAFFGGLWAAFAAPPPSGRVSAVWLRFDRWLVAALTFLLAADIIQTSVAPSWAEIGQVAAIAVIRTFLNYFLSRDMEELRRSDAASLLSAERRPE